MAVNKAYTSMLPTASDLEGALFNVSEVSENSDTGYESKKATIEDVGSNVVNDIEWQTDLTETTDKTITGAINEIASDLDDVKDEVADLKDLEGSASGDIATFVDGSANPLKELKISIEAVQSGSGDPSPTNVRPITGWTGANVYVSGEDTSDPTTYNINWQSTAGTVYSGTLNVKTGVLTVTHVCNRITTISTIGDGGKSAFLRLSPFAISINISVNNLKCNCLKPSNYNTQLDNHVHFATKEICALMFADVIGTTVAEWEEYLDEKPLYIYYKIETPIEYNITPTEIRSLLGQNNVWADCGEITELKYTRDLNLCINDIISRIEALEGGSSNRSISVSSNLTKSLTSELDETEGKTEETEEETKEEAQNER